MSSQLKCNMSTFEILAKSTLRFRSILPQSVLLTVYDSRTHTFRFIRSKVASGARVTIVINGK